MKANPLEEVYDKVQRHLESGSLLPLCGMAELAPCGVVKPPTRALVLISGLFAITLLFPACASKTQRHCWDLARSPDNTLAITADSNGTHMLYELRTADTRRILGKAESHWRMVSPPTIEPPLQRDVDFARDLSTISITEDLSDGCPSKRYILFTRDPNGRRYSAHYLNPRPVRFPSQTDIDYWFPDVKRLTATTITFEGVAGKPARTVPIAKVPVFAFPQNAE